MANFIVSWLEMFVGVFAAYYIHIIVHEGGHLIFGVFSGYKFVSFRIGSVLIKKENGRLTIKKFGIAGTSGQCLLEPMAKKAEDGKYRLYNAGGVIANFTFSMLSFWGYRIVNREIGILSIFFLASFVLGLVTGLLNGIPFKISGIANDGYNILSLEKDPPSRYGFWLQMKVNALLSEGKRLRDLPEEWFILEEGMDLNNPLLSAVALYHGQYYQDRMEFGRAKEIMLELMEAAPKLLPLFKNEITCSLILFELAGDCRKEETERFFTKEFNAYLKETLKYYPEKNVMMYAYEMLVNKDKISAEKYFAKYQSLCQSYPYPGEIEAARDTLDLIKKIIEQKST